MVTQDSARQPDRPWIPSAQPWVPESAPAACCPPAAVAPPARAVTAGWDIATVLVVATVLLCGIAVIAAVRQLDLVLGAGTQRVQVCNRFDPSPAAARCPAPDPFIVVRNGVTSASLQIAVAGDASRSRVPVTIDVSETNGMGLVVAMGTMRRTLQPNGAGIAVLPLQDVFAACRILLSAAPAGGPTWERATYTVQVRGHTTILGETMFHVAR